MLMRMRTKEWQSHEHINQWYRVMNLNCNWNIIDSFIGLSKSFNPSQWDLSMCYKIAWAVTGQTSHQRKILWSKRIMQSNRVCLYHHYSPIVIKRFAIIFFCRQHRRRRSTCVWSVSWSDRIASDISNISGVRKPNSMHTKIRRREKKKKTIYPNIAHSQKVRLWNANTRYCKMKNNAQNAFKFITN